jgi:hypothetical protein
MWFFVFLISILAPEGLHVNRKPSLGKVRSAPEVRYPKVLPYFYGTGSSGAHLVNHTFNLLI